MAKKKKKKEEEKKKFQYSNEVIGIIMILASIIVVGILFLGINRFNESNELYTFRSNSNEYVGYIVISDKMKKTSSKIKTFKNLIKKDLIILSGDVEDSVKVVAKKVGITKYESSMLPQDKVEYVEKLKKQNKVLFVGDGINDAPVLKISDVGVSMGQIGTDAAIEASDIVIMKDDLMKIKTSILIAKEIKKKTIENIVFVLGIKTLVLALAVMGISTIWMAVFADVGVTLISILNTLTIMWKKFD